jgi:hypothetical protein
MFFIKSESKRKNVLTWLVMAALMSGIALMDINSDSLRIKSNVDSFDSENVIQAGWFFGRHRTNDGRMVRRFFGITVGDWEHECPTYH